MFYEKRYNISELISILQDLKKSDRKYITIEDLLFEIGYGTLDINKFYIENIKHVIRYEVIT